MLLFNSFITHREDVNETSTTPWSRAASRRLFCLHNACPLRFGFRSRNDVSAAPACLRRAAELAHANGQLQQLELLDLERNQSHQCGESQSQVHALPRRSRPAEQSDAIFHAARRGRLHVCEQSIPSI